MISLHDCGVKNAVACMGTAISLEQLRLAACPANDLAEHSSDDISYRVNEVILLLDNDKAGVTAIQRLCTQVCRLFAFI